MDSIQSPKLSANHNTLVADSLNLDSFLHFWQSDTSCIRFPLSVVNFWFSASLSVSTRPPVTTLEQRGDSGWMRVVFLSMTDPSRNCPSGLKLTSHSRRNCGWADFARLLVYYIQSGWIVIQLSMWQGTGGIEFWVPYKTPRHWQFLCGWSVTDSWSFPFTSAHLDICWWLVHRQW